MDGRTGGGESDGKKGGEPAPFLDAIAQ